MGEGTLNYGIRAMERRKKPRRFVVSVRDFGAKGDGFTDDSAAFVAAAQSRALRIKIPPGVYMITTGVELDLRFCSVTKTG